MRHPRRPFSKLALSALLLALVALAIAFIGALNWNALRFQADGPLKATTTVGSSVATGVLPIVFGLAAALMGRASYKHLDQAHGKLGGDGFAFFSFMAGLFAVTIGACTMFAALIWPRINS